MLAFIEAKLASLSPAWLIGALITIAFVKAGVWYIPNSSVLAILAQNPFRNPYDGAAQYLYSNWLVALFAWLLHARDFRSYVLLNAAYSCIFMAISFASLRRALPDAEWRKAVCIFMCLPVSWAHLYWIGYDSLTLVLLSIVLAGLRLPVLTLVAGVGLGLQHLTQGFFSVVWLLVAAIALRHEHVEDGRKQVVGAAAALGGVLIGGLTLKIIIHINDIHLDYGRTEWLADHLRELIKDNTANLWAFAYCLLGPGWLFALNWHGSRRSTLVLGVALLGCAALTFISDDVTRVFAVISYPVIAFCLLYNQRWLARIPSSYVAMVLGVWIIVPWLFFWAGKVRPSLFIYDLAAVSQRLHDTGDAVQPPMLQR